jgi:hypothetical protein
MASRGASVFSVMVTFNTVMSLAYGPPALLGLVVERTPRWSGLVSFALGLTVGCVGSFGLGWGLITNVWVVVPLSSLAFLASGLLERGTLPRRDDLFGRLRTAVDVENELRDSPDPTARVFRFLSRATAAVGVLSLCLVFMAPAEDRGTIVAYVAVTLVLAALLSLVKGTSGTAAGTPAGE